MKVGVAGQCTFPLLRVLSLGLLWLTFSQLHPAFFGPGWLTGLPSLSESQHI